jgi:hypothetical protein
MRKNRTINVKDQSRNSKKIKNTRIIENYLMLIRYCAKATDSQFPEKGNKFRVRIRPGR